MKYKDLTEFVSRFEKRFGTKPKSVGLPKTEFNELEKDLEDLAPVSYTADYSNGSTITVMGVTVRNTGGDDHANVQFRTT